MKRNKKGFTLAELLIVVAIIAVLTAIAIPVFSSQLEKAKEATDQANLRAAYAEVLATNLTNGTETTKPVTQQQGAANWVSSPVWPENFSVDTPSAISGSWSVAIVKDGSGNVTGVKATYSSH